MGPGVDQLNHAAAPTALLQQPGGAGDEEEARVVLRPGVVLQPGEEVTISYAGAEGDALDDDESALVFFLNFGFLPA